jgi:hypothetical protein
MINLDQGEVTAEVTKLMDAGNYGGASALLMLASNNNTDTAKAETVASLVKEGESGGGKQVSMTVKKVKGKAKAKKAKMHPHAHKGVKLTARHWPVWVAVKALLDAKKELTKDTEGFYSLSGKFVAQFIGTPFWTKEEVNRVNAVMATLKQKGLLTWEKEQVGKSKLKIKGGIAFGLKA